MEKPAINAWFGGTPLSQNLGITIDHVDGLNSYI
jgi:hypothetical protein